VEMIHQSPVLAQGSHYYDTGTRRLGFIVSLAYPRRLLVILILPAGAICGFEYLQRELQTWEYA
jgi:hypothetical protein